MKQLHKILSFLCISFMLAACSDDTGIDNALLLYGSSSSSTSGTATSSSNSSSSSSSSSSSTSSSSSSSTSSASATASGTSFTANNVIYINLTDAKISSDNVSYSQLSTSATSFFDKTVKVKFIEDSNGVSTGVIQINAKSITENLAVHFTGILSEGGVKIQTSTDHETGIYLNGATINSTNYPCIDITKGGAATVFLSGTNTLVDGRKYGTGYGEEYSTNEGDTYTDDDETKTCTVSQSVEKNGSDSKGTLYCKGGLTICGDGTLSITQAYKNCIASKDGYLTIESGTYILKNYTSDSNTGKNGLFGAQGIIVNGGTITFDGKGIVTQSDLRKANAFKTDDDDYPESYVKINGGTINAVTYNGKGINAPKIYITGGTNKFIVTGVTDFVKDNKRTGSYYDADGVLVKCTGNSSTSTDSNTIYLSFAPEGIEGDSIIDISGGTTIVSAYDDGVNVSATGGNLNISGGFLYVSAKGDGLDSNGNITISGGITVVSQTGGGNSPIDCGDGSYKFTITGSSATVFAMGSSDMFSESKPSSTSIPYICSTSLGSSSSSLGVNGIIGITSPQTYAAAILISPELTNGTSYSFIKNGTVSGTEYVSDTGIYFPASVSGGTSYSATATTQASSSSSGGPGGRPGF
ncbi:MAG: carbohydrate-binding domain-containing protein [Treponema sp.]|nr:carbohydrate-binding domain-containing protein [Treponema sp.]